MLFDCGLIFRNGNWRVNESDCPFSARCWDKIFPFAPEKGGRRIGIVEGTRGSLIGEAKRFHVAAERRRGRAPDDVSPDKPRGPRLNADAP